MHSAATPYVQRRCLYRQRQEWRQEPKLLQYSGGVLQRQLQRLPPPLDERRNRADYEWIHAGSGDEGRDEQTDANEESVNGPKMGGGDRASERDGGGGGVSSNWRHPAN